MNFEKLLNSIQNTHDLLQSSVAKAINTGATIRNWLIGYHIVEYEQKGKDRATYGDELLIEISKASNIKGLSVTNLKVFRQFYRTYPEIGQTLFDLLSKIDINNNVSLIGQSLSDQSKDKDTEAIQKTESNESTYNITDAIDKIRKEDIPIKEYGLAPMDVIRDLSFSHIVELVKIDDSLKRAFYEIESAKGIWSVRELKRQIESLYFERSGISKDKVRLSELPSRETLEMYIKNELI